MKKALSTIAACAYTLSMAAVPAPEAKIRFFSQPENNNAYVSGKSCFFITSQRGELISELSFNNSGKMFNFEVSACCLAPNNHSKHKVTTHVSQI